MNTEKMLTEDKGFMHYDYNQTQTVYNQTALQEGEKYMAVMVPVARWYDGSNANGVYMRFTESWRSVKTDGWAISKAGVGDSKDKLHAALAIIDYAYSEKGQILMSYGPDAFIKTKADGSYVTFDFNGKQMPVIADATFEELWSLASGNYTNYARQYLGSTLSFVKSQAFEYQCTHEVGKEGAGKISNAIKYGTIKHPELAITENPWYGIVPTTLPNTKTENDAISKLTALSSDGKFSQSGDKDGKHPENLLIDVIVNGYNLYDGIESRETLLEVVKNTYGTSQYLTLKQLAWERLVEYYEGLNK
jgi:putative aldouronate transport system substrate-binding protein